MKLLIYGSQNFAETVADLVRHCGHKVAGMIDDYNTGPGIIGTFDTVTRTYPPSEYGIAMAIGYSNLPARWEAWQRIRTAGYEAPPLIHPRAYVADNAHVGSGSMVMAGAIVDVRVSIDELCVLWPAACVNHDTQLGVNTFVSPGAVWCGFVHVGAHSFIGAGAVIVDHGKVPERSFVKMLHRYTVRE